MADTKKYLDQTGLSKLWSLIGSKITNTITVDSVVAGDKVLKLEGKALSTKLDLTYDSVNKQIKLWGQDTTTPIASVDATAFIKDGMISSADLVVIPGDEAATEGRPAGTYLKLSFNSDANVDPVYLDVTKLIDVYVGKENEIVVDGQTISLAQAVKTDIATGVQAAADLASYKTTNDAAVAAAKSAGDNAQSDLNAYKTTNDAAVASKVAQTAYDADKQAMEGRVSTLESFISGSEGDSVQDLIDNSISANNTNYVDVELAKKLDKSTFESFQTSNTEALGTKVDKTTYDADKATFALEASVAERLSQKVDNTTYAADKATFAIETSVAERFDTKVDKSTYATDKATFAIAETVNAALDTKVDKSTYATDKATFATTEAMNAELAKKVNNDTYAADKATFALEASVAERLGQKVDKTAFETFKGENTEAIAAAVTSANGYTDGKVATLNTEIGKKVNTTTYEAYVAANDAAVKANADAIAALPVYEPLTDSEIEAICAL